MSSPMSVAEREILARRYAVELAPRLRSAIDRQDAKKIADLIGDLDRQHLLTLAVVLGSEWPRRRRRQLITCWGCGEERRHEGRGLCNVCRDRYDETTGMLRPPIPAEVSGRAGGLIGGPRAAAQRVEEKAYRMQECAHLASAGCSDEEIAARLGVSVVTVAGYREQLRRAPLQMRIPAVQQRRAS